MVNSRHRFFKDFFGHVKNCMYCARVENGTTHCTSSPLSTNWDSPHMYKLYGIMLGCILSTVPLALGGQFHPLPIAERRYIPMQFSQLPLWGWTILICNLSSDFCASSLDTSAEERVFSRLAQNHTQHSFDIALPIRSICRRVFIIHMLTLFIIFVHPRYAIVRYLATKFRHFLSGENVHLSRKSQLSGTPLENQDEHS